jgi:hypothetical protein
MTKRKFPTQFKRTSDDKRDIDQLFDITSQIADNLSELLNKGASFADNVNGVYVTQTVPPNVKTQILAKQVNPAGAVLVSTNGLILPGYAISVENGIVTFQHTYPTAVSITLYIMGK